MSVNEVAHTVFYGRAGDPNDLAMPGSKAIGEALARQSGISPVFIGTPKPALNGSWQQEMDAAMPELRAMQRRFEEVFRSKALSVAATGRCVVSLATLPVVAKYHPGVCVVWFDAHADLNTPDVSASGYLGGMALAGPLGLWDSGLGSGLRPEQIVLVGQRDIDPSESLLIARHNITCLQAGEGLAERLQQAIGGRAVYVHLDCDVLEPGIVPTDYVIAGGLTLAELKGCCEVLACQPFVGIEIAEFQYCREGQEDVVSPEPLLEALSPLLNRERMR